MAYVNKTRRYKELCELFGIPPLGTIRSAYLEDVESKESFQWRVLCKLRLQDTEHKTDDMKTRLHAIVNGDDHIYYGYMF